jgi:Cys-tRNA(Pro)/Cys-tRNA(Cys) deacylase
MAKKENGKLIHTPVTDFLDKLHVQYEIKYHSKPVFTSEDAAKERRVHLSQIIKTMLLTDGIEIIVVVLPSHRRIDMKKLKRITGHRNLRFMDKESISQRMGFIVGAIPPVGEWTKAFPVLVDPSVFEEEFLDISSGDPQAGLELHRNILKELLKEATFAHITKEQK